MSSRTIRLSSRALGDLRRCIVHVYDTADEMCAAGARFNGNDLTGSAGITQSYHNANDRTAVPIVRLYRRMLGIRVVSHEMHHAATAIYGSTVPDDALARDVLTHHDEPFAYLYSDLLAHLVVSLYRFGYYE
jgi:hypothetical protein